MRIHLGRFYIGTYHVPWWLVALLGPLLVLIYVAIVIPLQLISEIVEARAARRRRRALTRQG
jgi:hypothetical protein